MVPFPPVSPPRPYTPPSKFRILKMRNRQKPFVVVLQYVTLRVHIAWWHAVYTDLFETLANSRVYFDSAKKGEGAQERKNVLSAQRK
jgi:predicted anti-sigma-YlaC factor YlaD